MSSSKMRAMMVAGVFALGACMPISAFAYGLDGMFGGRPNPNGSVTVPVPVSTEETPDRAQSVLDHPRPDYDPLPIHVGSFLVTPAVETGVAYNSNIYATPKATSDDIFSVDPHIVAASDWGRNFLSITALGDFDFYRSHSSQNMTNTVVQADGRYDIANQTWAAGRAGYQQQTVPRATLNNNTGNQPTTFNLYTAGVSAYRGAGIVRAQLDYTFNRFDYSATANDGSLTGLNVYNRDENAATGRVAYVVTEDFKPYVALQVNERTYQSGDMRNSQGYRADAGATWDLGGITSVDLYGGWLAQNYDSFGAQPDNNAFDFGGKMTWNVTSLTTVVFDANRSIEEALIQSYNSFLATSGSATVTHELRRNLLLEADMAYDNEAYQGLSTRTDDVIEAGGGARYLINRNLYTDLDYSWNRRYSTVEGQGYVDHLVVAKLGLQF